MSPKKIDPERKGIHDPWRMGTPEWQPPADEALAGTKRSNEPQDTDLQPSTWYIFRTHGAALKIMQADNPADAAVRLLQAYTADADLRAVIQDAGFTVRPKDKAEGMTFYTPGGALCCPEAQSTDDGLQRLILALRKAVRQDRNLRTRLAKMGIIPILE
jgi:hypothetical protein